MISPLTVEDTSLPTSRGLGLSSSASLAGGSKIFPIPECQKGELSHDWLSGMTFFPSWLSGMNFFRSLALAVGDETIPLLGGLESLRRD